MNLIRKEVTSYKIHILGRKPNVHTKGKVLKSVNLQYDTLIRWADGINDSLIRKILQNPFAKTISNFLLFFHKITKMQIKNFECPKSIRNYWVTSRVSHRPSQSKEFRQLLSLVL